MYRRISLILILLALAHASAFAWEGDVHYVLTWWLATRAGFSRGDADTIANADQSYDASDHNAAIQTVLWIWVRSDLGAAVELQKKHFPSDGNLPSPPLRRVVVADSRAARAAVEAAIKPNTAATNLRDLGEGLHPFQDSWSHQGVPDSPFRPYFQLSPELVAAHPEARGGWNLHDADLTYLHVDDTLAMASKTYALLLRFLVKNPRLREHPAASWTKLEPIVHAFAIAANQLEKNAWAVKYVPASPDQLAASLTLPGTRSPGATRAVRPPKEFSAEAIVPPALVERANSFAETWMLKQDVPRAVAEFIDPAGLRAQFGTPPPAPTQPLPNVLTWSRKVLAMYLAQDHAAVNAAGHGDPSRQEYAGLPETAVRQGPFRVISGNLSVTPISGADFFIVKNNLGGSMAVAIQPSGLQHDAVCFVWSRIGDTWRIVRMLPVVD